MHLHSIDLSGFRCFALPTRLEFTPGVTGIVGPNGCGKTTLLAAIRWGAGMTSQCEVFHGTDSRPASPAASVTLTFTDGAKSMSLSRSTEREGPPTLDGEESEELRNSSPQPQALLTVVETVEQVELLAQNPEVGKILLLDEVDSDLHENEIYEFVEKLSELARHHQIIMATHSKIVMTLADTMVGVTMEEYGISKLIHMRLKE